MRLDTQLPILYYIHVLLYIITNNYNILYIYDSRGGGGVNTFFVGRRPGGQAAVDRGGQRY